MGRIVVSENATVDGVVQDPTGDEGSRQGGWFGRVTGNDRVAWAEAALAEARDARALLLGRRTYELFATRWPTRTGPLAERLNDMPKYVASSTLGEPAWKNCSVLTGDTIGAVASLKRDLDGDLVVYASFQLVRTLIEHELVDELRLTLFPSMLGAGERLLGGSDDTIPLRLVGTRALGRDLVFLSYEVGLSR